MKDRVTVAQYSLIFMEGELLLFPGAGGTVIDAGTFYSRLYFLQKIAGIIDGYRTQKCAQKKGYFN